MPRSGSFLYKFDPDEATPLPRPFILEGENTRGVKPVSLKPQAPPKNPDTYLPTTPDGLYSTAWFAEFAKIEKSKRVTSNPQETYLSEGLAKSIGAGNKKGVYIRWVTGYKYNVLTGKQDIPVYEYERVPGAILDAWRNGNPSWSTDPRKAMFLAKFFWKYGYAKDYRGLKKWMKQRANEIRADQQTQFNIWRNQQVAEYREYMGQWGSYFGR